jgi:hypothetical protein
MLFFFYFLKLLILSKDMKKQANELTFQGILLNVILDSSGVITENFILFIKMRRYLLNNMY